VGKNHHNLGVFISRLIEKKLNRFLFLNCVFILTIFLLNPRYGTPDDWILSELINGEYTGQYEINLIFIQIIIGFLFKIINLIFPFNNLYSFTLVQILIIVLATCFSGKKKSNLKSVYIVWILQSSFVLIMFCLRPTYTNFAIYSSVILIVYLTTNKRKRNHFKEMILWSILIFSVFIRIESIFIVILYLISIILVQIKFTRPILINFKRYSLGFVVLFIAYITNFLLNQSYTNQKWNNYNLWNSMRHQIHNRIGQFKLDQILTPNGWLPEEHNLFVDWAYGDPKIFSSDWLTTAFNFTKDYRGLESIKNLDFSYFIFNLQRYDILNNWLLIILSQFLLFTFLKRTIEFKKLFLIFIALWLPSLLIFTYSGFFLLLPDRVVLPIATLPIMILLVFLSSQEISYIKNNYLYVILIIVMIIYGNQIYKVSQSNLHENRINSKIIERLTDFNKDAIYFAPGSLNPFYSTNPFKFSSKKDQLKYLNVGSWDTFSPHWDKRRENLGFQSSSAYEDLFLPNVYWVGQEIPDTSLNIELLLEKIYKIEVSRSIELEIQDDLNIYKFTRVS
jgi:hypothetical protein